jgi:hypothetical protein
MRARARVLRACACAQARGHGACARRVQAHACAEAQHGRVQTRDGSGREGPSLTHLVQLYLSASALLQV